MQERRNSIANALELRLSCSNPSICTSHESLGISRSRSKENIHQRIFIDVSANSLSQSGKLTAECITTAERFFGSPGNWRRNALAAERFFGHKECIDSVVNIIPVWLLEFAVVKSLWCIFSLLLHWLMISVKIPLLSTSDWVKTVLNDAWTPGHASISLQWRHNERDGVSNHRHLDCLFSRLFRRGSKKHQSTAWLAFVRGIHRWPVDSPHKGPVTRTLFTFDDVIVLQYRRSVRNTSWT